MQTKTINGREYEASLLQWEDAERVLVRLLNVGGNALSSAQLEGGGPEAIASGIGGSLSKLKAEDLAEIRKAFMKVSSVRLDNGNMARLDATGVANTVWQGKLFEMFAWLAWNLEINFQDFFDGVRAQISAAIALGSQLMQKAETSSSSPTE